MNNLKYFQSVPVKDEHQDFAQGLETVLQQEHSSDGTHPRATSTADGFMTAEHVTTINDLLKRLSELETTVAAL